MTKKILPLILALSAFFIFNHTISAQQRFKAGLIVGLNASQILGDENGGYNRLGLQGGLRAITVFTEKSDLVFEILYSQRGSRGRTGISTLEISTNYIEVPVLFTFKDWLDEDGFYRIQVSGGFSYGRLLSASAIDSVHGEQVDNFNSNDISITLGAEFFTSEHFSFGARWSRSLNLLYNKDKYNQSINSLRGFFLSFRGAYIF